MGKLWGFEHSLHQDIFITNDIMINEKLCFSLKLPAHAYFNM